MSGSAAVRRLDEAATPAGSMTSSSAVELAAFLDARLDEERRAHQASRRSEVGLAEHLAHWQRGHLVSDLEGRRRTLRRCVAEIRRGRRVGDDLAPGSAAALAAAVLLDMSTAYWTHPEFRREWQPDDDRGPAAVEAAHA